MPRCAIGSCREILHPGIEGINKGEQAGYPKSERNRITKYLFQAAAWCCHGLGKLIKVLGGGEFRKTAISYSNYDSKQENDIRLVHSYSVAVVVKGVNQRLLIL